MVSVLCGFLRLGIVGLPLRVERGFMVRGEIVMRKSETPSGTIGRSWINGILHQKEPTVSDVQKIRFVAYEVMSDEKMTREEQFHYLKKRGYELPWISVVPTLTEEYLVSCLKSRRDSGDYDIDGIVVGKNVNPEWHKNPSVLQNPKDLVAFKMVLSDQCADTTVVAVHWAVSRQGYIIPRIEIEPVRIGGAVITYLTGHNAKNIVEKKVGKGARIRIRRSGDVIPTLDSVLEGAKVELPCETWDENKVHLVQKGANKEIVESRLHHFATTFEMDGVGPGIIKKLVEANLQSIATLRKTPEAIFQEILGKKTGTKVFSEIQKLPSKFTEKKLMIASSLLGRGVGDTKLSSLFAIEKNPLEWKKIQSADGWSREALSEFVIGLDTYMSWRKREFPDLSFPLIERNTVEAAAVEKKGNICFTGFRDAILEDALKKMGYTIQSTVNSKTNILVIPDSGDSSSSKYKTAVGLGTVSIVKKEELMRKLQ